VYVFISEKALRLVGRNFGLAIWCNFKVNELKSQKLTQSIPEEEFDG